MSSNVFINITFSPFLAFLNFNNSKGDAFLGNVIIYNKPWDFPVLKSITCFLLTPSPCGD